MIEQGGNYYVARIAGSTYSSPGTTGFFTNTASGLTASSFALFDLATGSFETGNPNFSSAGAALLFGVVPITADLLAGQLKTGVTDDLSFTISQTPLPAALPLFATGLGALGLLGWRRKRKNAAPLASANQSLSCSVSI
jgi:hypothetical protein